MSDDSITATRLKATLLGVLDEVARTGQTIVVTKHGKPVANIVPHSHEPYDLKGSVKQLVSDDELIAPFDTEYTSDADNIFGD
ncbi:MAG: type II toxin-antitoxin system prevent-host-death family antitoxin [Thermoleophilaceae bacterium]|nr:type II toxin-antitoxin system prevent-host-death family antitoxin [Thermoleophilaceae bacterium]